MKKHKNNKFLITILFLIILNLNVSSAQLHWDKIVDNLSYQLSSKPAPRRDSAIGHDRERNRVILFGGWQQLNENVPTISIPVLFDDTWEFNLETKLWRKLTFSLIRPAPRYGMTYTHNRYGLYVACGRGWLDEYYDDLWMYDFREDQWYKMDQTHISIVPEPRYGAFGGIYPSYEYSNEIKTNLYLAHGRNEIVMHENMYVYSFTDLRGLTGVWEKIYTDFLAGPFGYNYPHARMFASSAMISPDELIIYGGCLSGGMTGGPCPSSDSWLFSYQSNRWEKIDSSSISPRAYGSMASIVSDGYRKSAILFSGLQKDKTIISVEEERDDEIAVYDNLANKWVRKRVLGFYFPEKRNGHVMCTGRYRDQYGVFMFGGYGESSETNLADLWFLQANISTLFQPTFVPSLNELNYKWSFHFSTIHLHAIFMFVGWAVFLNVNMLLKRYKSYKKSAKSKMVNVFEKLTELFGILIVSGGMLLGLYSSHGLSNLVHALVGVGAYVLIILQPFTGYLINRFTKIDYYIDEEKEAKPKTKLIDSILNLIYKNTGYTAILFAAINISLGVFYAVLHWVWILVWFCFLVLSILVYIGIETKIYLNYSKNITQQTVPHTNEYDDNINLNESRTNLSVSSRHTHLSESKYSLSYTTTAHQPTGTSKRDKESSFTTINSFSPQIKLSPFDQGSYEKSLHNEKKILNKIQNRSNELHSMNNSMGSSSRRGIVNVNENFQDDVINYSSSELASNQNHLNESNRNLKQKAKFVSSAANLRY